MSQIRDNPSLKYSWHTKLKSPNLIFFRLINVPYGELFHKLDQQFKQPRAIIRIHVVVPAIRDSLENRVCMEILISYLNQQLETDTYAAILAKLYYSIKVTERGFLITLVGFNDRLLSLLYAILDHFKEFEKNLEKIKFSAVIDQAIVLSLSILSKFE